MREFGLELRIAVDILVCSNVVPLASHDEIALQVDKHDQNDAVPEDTRQNSDVLRVACRAAELSQPDDEVDSGDESLFSPDLLVAVVHSKCGR